MGLTVVGLGSGDEQQLTLGVWRALRAAEHVYLRTAQHPVVDFLQTEGVVWSSFDEVYERLDSFAAVYEEIAQHLLAAARERDVVYAVPGHPSVAERTVQLLRSHAQESKLELQIIGGESFLDQAFLRFGFDPIEGFQCLDGTAFQAGLCNPYLHTLIGQVYDTFIASEVKLGLMNMYPDDYEVAVGHSLGVNGNEQILRVPLYELDRVTGYGNLSVIWVPKANDDRLHNRTFARLREIVEILRSPDGCPWDREQTHLSIRKNLIEETCEVLDTIDADDPQEMMEELGDLLLQIMLHAQMEAEVGQFTVHDVIQAINDKLIRRHPHVFGELQADNAEGALRNWQRMKDEEKRAKGIDPQQQSLLAGLPSGLTALLRALKLQKKASGVGFDWSDLRDVLAKCSEEWAEWHTALEAQNRSDIEQEFGDVLFALVNVARFLKIDPEAALAATNRKFERRFAHIERRLREHGLSFADVDLAQMDVWWNEAKEQEFWNK